MKSQICLVSVLLFCFSICLSDADEKSIQDEVDVTFNKLKMHIEVIESSYSTHDEILGLLGPPLSKGNTGNSYTYTGKPPQETWLYFRHLDDNRFVSYTVYFPPEEQWETVKKETKHMPKCTVEAIYQTRSEIEKEPLTIDQGIVLQGSGTSQDGISICSIKLKDAYIGPNLPKQKEVSVGFIYPANSKRVEGTPIEGGKVTIKHRTKGFHFHYSGANSLRIESITFEANE